MTRSSSNQHIQQSIGAKLLTKGDVAISHPGCHTDMIVRGEARDLLAREQIPHDGGLVGVVAHDVTARTSLAHVVDGDEDDRVGVTLEAPLEREGVVMEAEDGIALSVQQHRRRRGAWLKVPGRSTQVDRAQAGGAMVTAMVTALRRRRARARSVRGA